MIDPDQIGEGELTEEQLIYKENIIDHYRHPHNKKRIEHPSVRHAEINPSCGDMIEVSLVIDNGRIADVGFSANGCAISQASMSMLSDRIIGMAVEDVEKLSRKEILEMLGIPIGIVRMKCALLGLRTTQRAIHEA